MSKQNLKKLCDKFLQPRIFVDDVSYTAKKDFILNTYKTNNEQSWSYNVDKKKKSSKRSGEEYLLQAHDCYYFKKSMFSLLPDYEYIDEQKNYYPYFFIHTDINNKVSNVFAYVRPDAISANDENMKMMEVQFHEKVKDMESK